MTRWLGISCLILGVISIMLGVYVEFFTGDVGVSGIVPILLGASSIVIGAIVIRQSRQI